MMLGGGHVVDPITNYGVERALLVILSEAKDLRCIQMAAKILRFAQNDTRGVPLALPVPSQTGTGRARGTPPIPVPVGSTAPPR